MLSKNLNSFLRPLKNKGFKEEIVTKIGLYDIVKSTTLESNKSLNQKLKIVSEACISKKDMPEKMSKPRFQSSRVPACDT
jgi:hypothetical protein